MNKKFYQKVGFHVAMATAGGVIIITSIIVFYQRSDFRSEKQIKESRAEIQRLELLLAPFKTIAREKYAGDDAEMMQKLADYIVKLKEKDLEQTNRIQGLQREFSLAKKMHGLPLLDPGGMGVKKIPKGFEAITQFKPSRNSDANRYKFTAKIIKGEAKIESFGGNRATTGGDSTVSKDKKSAEAYFNPLEGNPVVKIIVSSECVVKLSGSHLDRNWSLNIK